MIETLPPPPPANYQLVEDLRDSKRNASVYRLLSEDLPSEQALLDKLGARGWGRVQHFRNHYNQPWGEARNPPVSPKALEGLARFVTGVVFHPVQEPSKKPSVFLTDRGGLELSWEDSSGAPLQVEFRSDGIDYYIAAAEDEGSFTWNQLSDLIRKFSNV